ncbi:MAG: hypothetical protein A2Y72_02790 [Chloroflexi bacterium RBG_13_53_26]|nr:MAG: hypothetical protein A2Y72_02790 [Chloroflexi bacterium RBG_13_53_26]
MGLKDKRLVSIKEIDGPLTPHDAFIKRETDLRKEAFRYVADVSRLAEYIGGEVESLGVGEDWGIRKEVFPEIRIHFLYTHADEEFPSNVRVLFSGDNIKKIRGEDLVELTVACLNHMLRYVKETAENPPEICTRV